MREGRAADTGCYSCCAHCSCLQHMQCTVYTPHLTEPVQSIGAACLSELGPWGPCIDEQAKKLGADDGNESRLERIVRDLVTRKHDHLHDIVSDIETMLRPAFGKTY
jgi:hypothetical protein